MINPLLTKAHWAPFRSHLGLDADLVSDMQGDVPPQVEPGNYTSHEFAEAISVTYSGSGRHLSGWAMQSITAAMARIRMSFSPGATSTP